MKHYFTLILLGFIHFITAQHTIKGIILDDFFKNPIPNVEIYAPELHKSVTTNSNGIFILKDLPNRKIKLVISASGFKTKTLNIDKSNYALKIILEAIETSLDELIISLPFNKLQSQNVMKVAHQDIQSLKEMGSNTLIDGIANLPGVDQISTGISISKPVIRGLSGNRVLTYLQGVRLENLQFGDEYGLGINQAGIESVEIIKGPASLLYGSDAIGGVLYFTNEKFADINKTNGEISEKYSANTDGYNTSAMFRTSGDKLKIIGRATYETHKDYKIAKGNKVTNTRYKEKDYKVGIGYSNNKFSSTLRYNYNDRNLGINENGIAEQTDSRDPDLPRLLVKNHIISLHNQFFFKKSKIDANFGYLYNDFSDFEYSNTASSQLLLETYNFDLKYHFPKFKGLETIIGIQGMQQNNRNKITGEILIPNADIQDYGVLTTANYQWNKNVIQAGVRFDNRDIKVQTIDVDKKFNSFNASLGYKTKLLKHTILRLNVATGYRAPNLAELASDGFHDGTNRYEIGTPDLKNEQNIQTDLNLTFNNGHVEFFTNGFYNIINQYIYLSPTNALINNIPVFNYIQEDASLLGGEFGFNYHPKKIDWLHLQSNYEMVVAQENDGAYLPLTPADKINTTIKTVFDKNSFKDIYFLINLQNVFKQTNVGPFETVSNGYNLLNLGFGSSLLLENLTMNFYLNANNVLDTKYISHLSRLKINSIPNQGRNISIGLDIKL